MHMGYIKALGKTHNEKTEASEILVQGGETETSDKNGSWETNV